MPRISCLLQHNMVRNNACSVDSEVLSKNDANKEIERMVIQTSKYAELTGWV